MTREEILKARLPELIATMPPMPPLRKPVPAPEVRTSLEGKVGARRSPLNLARPSWQHLGVARRHRRLGRETWMNGFW
jgi:hypothetical protein